MHKIKIFIDEDIDFDVRVEGLEVGSDELVEGDGFPSDANDVPVDLDNREKDHHSDEDIAPEDLSPFDDQRFVMLEADNFLFTGTSLDENISASGEFVFNDETQYDGDRVEFDFAFPNWSTDEGITHVWVDQLSADSIQYDPVPDCWINTSDWTEDENLAFSFELGFFI